MMIFLQECASQPTEISYIDDSFKLPESCLANYVLLDVGSTAIDDYCCKNSPFPITALPLYLDLTGFSINLSFKNFSVKLLDGVFG